MDIKKLVENLKAGEKLEINSNGEIRIAWRNETGKKKSKAAGNLFKFADEIIPLKTKLWATPPLPGKQKYYNFGVKLSSVSKKDYESDIIIGIFLTGLDENQKPDFIVDGNMYAWKVLKNGDIKGFYSKSGKLLYVELNNKKYFVENLAPKLKTQKFSSLDEVK